jgi:hypothetical protein
MGCLLRDNGLSDSTVIFVECLLGAGATFTSLDSCDNNGLMIWTEQTCSQTQAPIFRAVLNLIVCSQPDLLHAIIDLDSELTLKTSDGQTILHLATVALHESCVPFEIAIRVFNNQPLLLRVGLVGCQAPIQSLMSLHKQPINL